MFVADEAVSLTESAPHLVVDPVAVIVFVLATVAHVENEKEEQAVV